MFEQEKYEVKNIFNSQEPPQEAVSEPDTFNKNLFMSDLKNIPEEKKEVEKYFLSHLNDFDSSLIIANVNKTVKNKSIKIELKLKKLEKELDKVNETIEVISFLNVTTDKSKLSELQKYKISIENHIVSLKKEYRYMGLFYHMSSFIEKKSEWFNQNFLFPKFFSDFKWNLNFLNRPQKKVPVTENLFKKI